MTREPQLGSRHEVVLEQARIPYYEAGNGDPMVFVHGMYANGSWWRNVAPRFSATHRTIVPDLPFGSHAVPAAPDADLSPPGLARIVADFLEALELDGTTLVAGDLGGAITQLVIADRPERLGSVVLLSCDAYENFPPAPLRYQCWMSRLPGARAMTGFSARLMRRRWARELPITFRYATKRPVDHALIDGWLEPLATNPLTQRDAVKILRGVDNRHTLAAARSFGSFEKRVLLVWGVEDRLFPYAYAERLANAFPNARLAPIQDAYTYVVEDQPERVCESIQQFLGGTAGSTAPR